jgi:hypothetical protein
MQNRFWGGTSQNLKRWAQEYSTSENMGKREAFLLRADPTVLEAIRKWADDEMRSMNAQIEFILRSKLKEAGRLAKPTPATQEESEETR